jgi:hypothetical protein
MGKGLSTGQKIVTYAAGERGKTVGSGECWELANAALGKAGGQSSADFGPTDDDADYVWGDPVANLKDVLPGDILQFRDYVITVTVTTEASWNDGAEWSDTQVKEVSRPHHTAIVSANQGNGVLTIYEQNVEPLGRVVQLHTLNTADIAPATKKLKKKVKRPVAPRKGLLEMADVVETTSLEVSGKIWAYRPKLKK